MYVHNSRFLQSVSEIAPKSIYVSGKSVSGAGLTVSAEKDELGEGGWTLKAGALVLASGGTAQVDEFDKIEEEDRAALHEAMESQSISVAKAGIVAKFRTKTAILAAANPKYGRFDQTKNLADQFDVPPTLLSRFDLIFPIVDVLDEEKDTKLAEHILSTHMGKDTSPDEVLFDKELLRKYIAYARRKVFPKLLSPASHKIKEFYVELRRKSKDAGSVAITPRYLEGLVRLAEANAKMRLSDTVEEDDAEVAIALFNYVMQQIMTDKATGKLDVDVVIGKPKSERDKLQKADTILDIIREHLRKSDTAEVEQVIADAKSYDIDEATAKKIIAEMLRRGVVYEKEYGHIRIVGE
jgi:replicative DNA helicase Mcm